MIYENSKLTPLQKRLKTAFEVKSLKSQQPRPNNN